MHCGPHTWPVWGNAEIVSFIESQRDTYKYIHDQALRLANKGYTPLEAAEVIELPAELGRKWFNRGYHGTLHHDVRAADYRWAAEILHKLVFAQPDNQAARDLQADAYEQMGYQVEGPQWRGILLTAAGELREGVQPAVFATASPDTILAMPIDILFDFAAVHIIGDRSAQADLRIGFAFTDLDETWTVWVRRGVLNARRGASPDVQLTVSGPKAALVGAVLQPAAAGQLAQAGRIKLDGDPSVLATLAGLMDTFDPDFNVVTP